MTADDRPDRVTNQYWNGMAETRSVGDVFENMMSRIRLHLKSHKQGKTLYWMEGRFWIRCYTHKRLEPATWLV